jgi:hypothetical protein
MQSEVQQILENNDRFSENGKEEWNGILERKRRMEEKN